MRQFHCCQTLLVGDNQLSAKNIHPIVLCVDGHCHDGAIRDDDDDHDEYHHDDDDDDDDASNDGDHRVHGHDQLLREELPCIGNRFLHKRK